MGQPAPQSGISFDIEHNAASLCHPEEIGELEPRRDLLEGQAEQTPDQQDHFDAVSCQPAASA